MNLNNLFEAANPAQQAAIAISMKKAGKKPKSEDVAEEKVRLDPKCWTGKKIGNPKTKVKGGVRVNNCVPAESINEFAPVGGDDREPNEEEILRQLAAMWWLGTEQQMAKAQNTLAAMGWEIGQDESGDDDAGVFLIRPGDEHGDTYIAFNHSDLEELNEGMSEGSQRVDSLVTDALKIMHGSEMSDAVAALKTVLGDREYNGRRGHYNFYVRQLMDMYGRQGVAEGMAQDEAEEYSGWRAELVNQIKYNTFEVKMTNTRSKESANFIVRPVDMISHGPTLAIETMDVHDLQTGRTESWTSDDPQPDGGIVYAISGMFYDNKELQKKLWTIVDQSKDQDMMPGLDQRRSIGQEVDADDYIDSQKKTQAAMAKMKKGVAEAGYSNYDDNRTGFRRPPREDDEGHEQDRHREQQEKSGTWYIRLNGKLIKDKQGNPYSYRGKAAANKAALTMQAKLFNQGKEFMLTTNPNDKVAEASYINGKIEDPDSLRWKQTSMSYQEAVSKYGKDHVRMQSKSRLGDDIVEVLVPLGEDLSRRGFLKGLGAAAMAGAAGGAMAQSSQQQDLGNGFVLTTIDVAGHTVKAVLDTESNISVTPNRGSNGSAIIRSQARFLLVKDGKIVDTGMDVGPATKAAMKKAGLLPGLDESQQSGYGRGYASYKSSK